MDQKTGAKTSPTGWILPGGGLDHLIFLSAHFGAMRAFREVCPKHRNIRRESCGCDASGKDR
jgi:hypothetical protein